MVAKVIDGKAVALKIQQELMLKVAHLKTEGKRAPGLAVVLVGENPASQVYVRNKKLACERVGFHSFSYDLPDNTTQEELLALVDELNENPEVDGILVQLPLPDHLDEEAVIEAISPQKDVDGFHPYNLGRLAQRMPKLMPCTPHGVMTLLRETGVPIQGANAVVVGASNIVGVPMMLELLNERATVTICHSKTQDLQEKIAQADILVVGVGKARFIPGQWIKPGACVIDVGINRLDDGRLCGDVDFDSAKEVAGYITPVPGGVGPMTIATLMENTLAAYLQAEGK